MLSISVCYFDLLIIYYEKVKITDINREPIDNRLSISETEVVHYYSLLYVYVTNL